MTTDIIAQSLDVVGMTYVDEDNNVQPIQPESAYLVGVVSQNIGLIGPIGGGIPSAAGEHERYVTDKNNLISKQVGSVNAGGGYQPPTISDVRGGKGINVYYEEAGIPIVERTDADWSELTGDQSLHNLAGFTDGFPDTYAALRGLAITDSGVFNEAVNINDRLIFTLYGVDSVHVFDLATSTLLGIANTLTHTTQKLSTCNGKIFVGGKDASNNFAMSVSSDLGESWTVCDLGSIFSGNDISNVIFDGTNYLSIYGTGSNLKILKSTDGGLTFVTIESADLATYISGKTLYFIGGKYVIFYLVKYDNGYIFTFGAYSTDLVSWTFYDVPDTGNTEITGLAKSSDMIMMSRVEDYNSASRTQFLTSTDGVNWDFITPPVPKIRVSDLNYSDGVFTVSGNVYYEGLNFSFVSYNNGQTWELLVDKFFNGIFYYSPTKTIYGLHGESSVSVDRFMPVKGKKFENKVEEYLVNGKEIFPTDKTLDINTGESYSLDEEPTGGTWIDGKPIYTKVKLTSDPDPENISVRFPDRIVETYTVLHYTKTTD